MLKITDLKTNKEMGSEEMAGVRGGFDPVTGTIPAPTMPSFDFSTSITSKVAAVTQGFEFALAQGNEGAVTNNQEILGGNGSSWSPVSQSQHQGNWMAVDKVGTVSVGS